MLSTVFFAKYLSQNLPDTAARGKVLCTTRTVERATTELVTGLAVDTEMKFFFL